MGLRTDQPRQGVAPTVGTGSPLLQRKRFRKPYHTLNRLERLVLDQDRVNRFRLAVSANGDYAVYHEEIRPDVWDYANRTLPTLVASGRVFTIRSRLGQPHFEDLVLPADGIDLAVAEDLSAETIERALGPFGRIVLTKWDAVRPDAATLGPYFINLCSMVFPGPFRRWHRTARALDYFGAQLDPDLSLGASSVWDEPDAAIYEIEFERYIDFIEDPVDEMIIRLDDLDLTDPQIAEVLDLRPKQVEYRLSKFRRQAQVRWAAEQAADNFRGQAAPGA